MITLIAPTRDEIVHTKWKMIKQLTKLTEGSYVPILKQLRWQVKDEETYKALLISLIDAPDMPKAEKDTIEPPPLIDAEVHPRQETDEYLLFGIPVEFVAILNPKQLNLYLPT